MTTLSQEQARQLAQERINLIQDLTSPYSEIGDWKIMKIQEAALVGQEVPYDINALHTQRAAARARINEIEQTLAAATISEP